MTFQERFQKIISFPKMEPLLKTWGRFLKRLLCIDLILDMFKEWATLAVFVYLTPALFSLALFSFTTSLLKALSILFTPLMILTWNSVSRSTNKSLATIFKTSVSILKMKEFNPIYTFTNGSCPCSQKHSMSISRVEFGIWSFLMVFIFFIKQQSQS